MAHTTQQQLGGLLLNPLRVKPVAISTHDDVDGRILSHLNLPAAPEPTGPGGLLAWDLGDERLDDSVFGMDPEPPDMDVTERCPPYDEGVDPPAPDCRIRHTGDERSGTSGAGTGRFVRGWRNARCEAFDEAGTLGQEAGRRNS
ncbi:MAG: hypothetical protein MUF54_24470 [Polyangiaceae bacterium]|jgi:hypothetical protein|nr:hypothetical protein [Polyangiaceae bacterium]